MGECDDGFESDEANCDFGLTHSFRPSRICRQLFLVVLLNPAYIVKLLLMVMVM